MIATSTNIVMKKDTEKLGGIKKGSTENTEWQWDEKNTWELRTMQAIKGILFITRLKMMVWEEKFQRP